MSPRQLDRFDPSGCGDDADAGAFEQAGQDATVRRAVVDDQSRQLFPWRKPGIERRTGTFDLWRSARRVLRRGNQWKREEEPAPFAWNAFHLQFASHLPDQVIADGETKACAAGGGACLRLHERFKNRPERLGLDAHTRVADLEDESPLAATGNRQLHVARWRELDGVAEQIQEHLPQMPAVEYDASRHVRSRRHGQPQALPVRRFGDDIGEVGDELREIGWAFFDIQSSRLDLRKVEHVVDQLEQLRPALRNRLEGLELCGIQAPVALQELCVTQHAVQRRPQLVAHVRKELAFRPGSRLGRLLRAMQLGVSLTSIRDVPEERPKEEAIPHAHRRRDRELDREFATSSMKGRQLETLVHHRGFTGFVEPSHPAGVGVPKCVWNDRLGQVPAEHFVVRPSEGRLGLRVPRNDLSGRIHADKGVVRGIHDETRAGFTLGQTSKRVPTLLLRNGHDDEVADRDGEVLLIDRPGSRASHVLGAQNTHGGVVVPQRHVEHRADIVRSQIWFEELAGARIGPRVIRRHDPIALEGFEVRGGLVTLHRRARLVPTTRPLIEADALDR